MKTLLSIFGLFLILSLSACVGDDGPIGPSGPQGPQGPEGEPGVQAFVFDFQGVTFASGNNYSVLLPYDNNFVALDSDVTLVYFSWFSEVVDGVVFHEWRALPQMLFTENGILQYNYDWTIYDVLLFMDADYPLELTTVDDRNDWDVRVVVIPGEFWTGGKTAYPSYEELSEKYDLGPYSYEVNAQLRRSL